MTGTDAFRDTAIDELIVTTCPTGLVGVPAGHASLQTTVAVSAPLGASWSSDISAVAALLAFG